MDTFILVFALVLALAAVLVWRLSTPDAWPDVRLPGNDRQVIERAEQLVKDVLTEPEWRQLQEKGYLEIPSQLQEGRLYRIPGGPGLVEQIEPGGRRRLLCLVPLSKLPAQELVVVHKLWLEADEAQYLKMANRIPFWSDSLWD